MPDSDRTELARKSQVTPANAFTDFALRLTESHVCKFWSKVDKSSGQIQRKYCNGRCWIWIGQLVSGPKRLGYGVMSVGGRATAVHRISWFLENGKEIPAGMVIAHRCDNPRCVRPSHLWLATYSENTLDAVHKGRMSLGSRNGRSVLNEQLVEELRRTYSKGFVSQKYLAKKYGVATLLISRIVNGDSWKHVPVFSMPVPSHSSGTALSPLWKMYPVFWPRVRVTETCWEWTGSKTWNGYGEFYWKGKKLRAHIVSWRMVYGEVPDGKMIRHKCDNKLCVRPDHLLTGTAMDNTHDMMIRGRHNPGFVKPHPKLRHTNLPQPPRQPYTPS